VNTALLPGEQALKDGPANLQRGAETVGGRLYLTSQRLVFEPHALNVQRQAGALPLAQIQSVELGWTKFLGLLPLAPNALIVGTTAGEPWRLTLWGRAEWLTAIEAARAG